MTSSENETVDDDLIPGVVTGIVAIICAVTLVAIAALGPAFLGVIRYRTSQAGIIQTIAFDLTDLVLLVPLLLVGGVLQLSKRGTSKWLLILTPITLMTVGFEYGLAEEWSSTVYTGNVEAYSWLYLTLIIGGLILLFGSLPRFSGEDAPSFNKKWLRVYVGVMVLFLTLFAVMWSSQIHEVISTGDLTSGDYSATPNGFWVVRYFDLGVTIPLGFMALLLLLSKPKKAYPILLLFFGFFITLGASVNVSALLLILNHDPSVSGSNAGGLFIFPILGALSFGGLFYLVKDKIRILLNNKNGARVQ